MDLIFHYFAFIAAAVCAINLAVAGRRLDRQLERQGPGRGPLALAEERERAQLLLRVWYGSALVFFLALGAVQLVRGYSTVFFMFAPRPHDPLVIALWVTVYATWAAILFALWRPGLAETALRVGLIRGQIPPTAVRVVGTVALLINAVAFTLLLAGVRHLPAPPQ